MKSLHFSSLCIVFLILNTYNAKPQTILPSQGFENGGNIPVKWDEELASGSRLWRFWNGGSWTISNPTYKYPAHAHTGSYNAIFVDESFNAVSRLITQAIRLDTTIKPVITFWHAQDTWGSSNDNLNVYYRTTDNTSQPWIPLESYTAPLPNWTYHEIILPDGAKVQKCQIAFEGVSNWGFGVCLDDISIVERGILPRQVESINLIQKNQFVPSGSNSNSLGYIKVVVKGNSGNIPLNSFSTEYSGTSLTNDINTGNFELFYTRDTIFTSKTKLNPNIAAPVGNSITFSNINYNLQTGENYIWICASVKNTATYGNIADFKINQNSINIGGILFPGGNLDPQEYSTIEESIFYDGFESNMGWQLSAGSCWARGIPTGMGLKDPNYAFSGANVLATNLSGNYPSQIHVSNAHTATTPSINCKYYQNINIRFKRWLNIDYFDKARVKLSIDGGSTWIKLMENNNYIFDLNWTNISYNISQYATRKQNIKVMFSIDSSDFTTQYGGWNIDNLAVTGDFIAKDLGVSGIIIPVSQCGMKSDEIVKVKIKNYGGTTVDPPFVVGFSLDNGVTYTKDTVNVSVPFEGEIEHTFSPAKANLSQPGLKQMKFKTFLTGDEDLANDTYSTTLFVYPTVNYVYQNSFESSNGYWNPGGTNSSWAWGIVAKTNINKAFDGTKVWVNGGLKGSYGSPEQSYLESPCIDFSLAEYPVIAFNYWVNTEAGIDGFRLDFSIDGGNTWNPVTANSNHNANWCNGSAVSALGTDGWTGSTATGYQTARTLLPSSVNGKNNVKFRFVFASDANSSMEGVAIDNIKIYELPYDIGIKRLVSPISDCYIGNNVQLVAKVINNGYRPLKVGLKVPIEIKLRSENVVKDTLVVGSLVAQNDSISFTSTNNYNIFTKGSHTLRLNTNYTPDLSRLNDTLKTTLQVKGIPGYSLGADKAVTLLELADSVKINAGLNGAVLFNSYLWSAQPSLLPLTQPTSKDSLKVNKFGLYNVTVTNENGCTAIDTIEVLAATSDIEILPGSNLIDSCKRKNLVYPQITIRNNGEDAIGIDYPMKSIHFGIMVDGVVKVPDEIYTPSFNILKTETATFTFTNGINIETPNLYKVRIYSKVNADPNKNNDTLKVPTNVWGMPNVEFPYDTIVTQQANTLILNAGRGFASYKWNNLAADTSHTFNIPIKTSAWYKVTVTDIHTCGSDKDSVFVNAKDLSVLDIESPFPTFCNNNTPKVAVRIKNSGQDDFSSGSIVKLTYTTPNESISQNFPLIPALLVNESRLLPFNNFVNLPLGEGFVRVTADIANDPNPSNDVFEKSVEKLTNPTVSFNPPILNKVFGAVAYYVSPIYSSDVKSYAWQDLNRDSLYTIIGTPPSRTLQVIAYDQLDRLGCTDTASLHIVSEDLVVDSIKSPTNMCVLGSGIPIKVIIANKGNFAYPSGTSFTLNINVDGIDYPSEIKSLATNLDPEARIELTLNPILNLTGKTSSITQVTVSTSIDANTNNNTLNKTVYSTGFPTISLGVDRLVRNPYDTLKAGESFQSYAWKYNSNDVGTSSKLVAMQTGTYLVEVTDFNGCSASDDVVLTFVVDDIALDKLDNPITGCSVKDVETVKVTVKNTGTEIIPIGKSLNIGFKHEGVTQTENFTITGSNLTAGQSRSFDLTPDTMSISVGPNPIKVWVRMTGDMNPTNDTLNTSVVKYPPVSFNFGIDTIKVTGPDTTIDAVSGFTTYLWSTSTTAQTINVTTAGNYWVELTNSYGCIGRDTVYVKIGHADITLESLVAPATSCSLSTAETITVRLKNTGTYNNLPIGTVIPITLKINGTPIPTENCILSSILNVGDYLNYSFTNKQNLSAIGDFFFEISSSMSGDEVSSNNSITKTVSVFGNPAPNLGADRIIIGPTPLNPGTFTTYTWQDGSHNPTFTASATGKYSVTVTDDNLCSGYDEVNLTLPVAMDIRATQLFSPSTNCFDPLGQTVLAQLTNMGTQTFTSGESIKVNYQVGSSGTVVEETMNFTSNFANGQTLNYPFTQKAIINPGTVTIYCKTIISGNIGQTTGFPVTINAKPTVDLGLDRNITGPTPLDAGAGVGYSYTWQDNSHNQTFIATATGKYAVTVTNAFTCQGYDEVNLTLVDNVATIPGSNAKVTVFPNPVTDELTITIETDKNEEFSIDLINPQGQIVKNLKTEITLYYNDKINVNGFTPGVYFIKVSTNKGSAVFKVVIQH